MTIGELKAKIAPLDDSLNVVIEADGWEDYGLSDVYEDNEQAVFETGPPT
jgi:hypothetical protein